jgi:hypothetical protein
MWWQAIWPTRSFRSSCIEVFKKEPVLLVQFVLIRRAGHFSLCHGVQSSTSNWSFANIMRVRGVIVLAAGLPFWIYLVWVTNEIRKSPFGYEFGSVAFPQPPQFQAARFVAVISLFLGLSLLVADFINWIKKRPTDPSGPPG